MRFYQAGATILVLAVFVSPSCNRASGRQGKQREGQLKTAIEKLETIHAVLRKPGPSDWLSSHREHGQTFDEYLKCRPVTPMGKRRVIYVQPLGPFSKEQRKIVELSAEFLGIYYNRPVKIKDDLALDVIPEKARRKHPIWNVDQILTTYVLHEVLRPRLPDDGAAIIAFTASDLWPGKDWNFVFGQASLRDRVGVWSINRNGNPTSLECLLRTLKTATHETGHMFSIKHCTAFECNMCGSNNRRESDRLPLYLCPQCVAKVCWATQSDPIDRYTKLKAYCEKNQLTKEAEFYNRSLQRLGDSSHADEN